MLSRGNGADHDDRGTGRRPARGWRTIPSSPSTPNSCAKRPIIRCSASRRWRARDEAVVIDALAPGIDLAPFFDLMANEKVMKVFHAARQDIEIVWHRAKHHSAPDLRHPGRRHGARLWRLRSPTTSSCSASPATRSTSRTASPTGRAVRSPTRSSTYAVSDVTHLRDVYLDARRRSRQARPHRLGGGRDGSPDLARHLPHGAGARLAAAQDARAQAEGARGADGGRGLARARGADARRAARRACSRTT